MLQTPNHLLARLALWPLSRVYRAGVRFRASAYRRGWLRTEELPVPVISLGNLSVGGTGKTPLVEAICRFLEADGLRPGIVSRGYRRRGGTGLTVVSTGNGQGPAVDVSRAGDEPFLLATHLPGVPLVVAADRVAAARRAVELGARVIVADDAFQHLRLGRQIDFLVIDATNPTEAGWLLPSGRLREPLEAAGRASAFLLTRCDRMGDPTAIRRIYRPFNPEAPFFETVAQPQGLLAPDGAPVELESLRGAGVVAFCGIGSPRFFLQDLERQGAKVLEFAPFPDHHWFTDAETEDLADRFRRQGADVLVTTEKDHVRLTDPQRRRLGAHRLRIGASVWNERQLLRFLRKRLAAEAAA